MTGHRALRTSLSLLAAILVAPLLFTACGDSGSPGSPGAKFKNLTIPKIDPNAPFPAMSGAMLDALAADVPELAKRKEGVLAAEHEAIKGALDIALGKSKPAAKSKPARKKVSGETPSWILAADAGSFSLISAAMASDRASIGMAIGVDNMLTIVGANSLVKLSGMVISDQDTSSRGGSKSGNIPGEKGEVIASATISAEAGGPVSVEITTKSDFLFIQANSKASVSGNLCPDADGKVEFTTKLASDGRAGSGGSSVYDRSVEAKITATVGDDANTVNLDFEMKQATRSTTGGRQVYVESSQSGRAPGGDITEAKLAVPKIIRKSSQATQTDMQLVSEGLERAYWMTLGAFKAAENHWKDGKCIRINAKSPGTVAPGATSKIPVSVTHRKDKSSLPAKVTVRLSGGASVDPGVIAKAPGDVTHVASKEKQATMTINLKATSRRGADETSLDINTNIGAAYRIVGGLDDWKTNTAVCDIMKPFTLTGGGITMQVSGGLSGTYSYTGPFNSKGTGTYTISLPDGVGKPGSMTGFGPGSVVGGFTNTGTEKYTLSPLEPCS